MTEKADGPRILSIWYGLPGEQEERCQHPHATATREDGIGRFGHWYTYTRFDIRCPDCGKHIEIDASDPRVDVRGIIAQEFGEERAREWAAPGPSGNPLGPATHDDQLDALRNALGTTRWRDLQYGVFEDDEDGPDAD